MKYKFKFQNRKRILLLISEILKAHFEFNLSHESFLPSWASLNTQKCFMSSEYTANSMVDSNRISGTIQLTLIQHFSMEFLRSFYLVSCLRSHQMLFTVISFWFSYFRNAGVAAESITNVINHGKA